MEQRIANLEKRMDSVEAQLRDNTNTTNAIKNDTTELVEILRASKVGARFLKWSIGVGASAATLWAAIRGFGGFR